jgi:Spy/CpxP family protein refolding chaperone
VNGKKTLFVVCAMVVLCLSARVSWAQQEPAARGGRGAGGAGQALTPVELERWLDSYVLIQAQDALKITDAQFPRFLQRLNALQATRRRNAAARRQILATVGRQLRATPVDEAGMREQLKALRELDVRAADELRKAYDGLDEALEPVQQAKFRLFEQQVERRQIELLMKARERAGEAVRPGPAVIR